jgi:hypothetical protein
MKLREDAWTQVDGDVSCFSYGGVFARLCGDDIELLALENVEDHIGRNEAREVEFPFWTSEGYYDPDDLKWSDDAESALESTGTDLGKTDWEGMEPIERACRLFMCGYGKEPSGGGFALDVLPDQPVIGWGNDPSDIRLDALLVDDEFNLDILHKVEMFRCIHLRDHKPLTDPYIVRGRHSGAEWTREVIQEAYDEVPKDHEEEVYTDWRHNPYRVDLHNGDILIVEPFHTFHSYDNSPSALYEAADILSDMINTGSTWEDLDDEIVALLKDAPTE